MLTFIRLLIAVLIVGILATGALWLFGGRRSYRDAAQVMIAVLALAVLGLVGWGLFERYTGHAADDPALVQDAEQTLYAVQPSAFDHVSDCLRQLGALSDFYQRHPKRYADALADARAALSTWEAAAKGLDPARTLCAEFPELERSVASGQALLRAAARTR